MASFIDTAFLNQAQSVRPADYLEMFYKSFNLAQTLPWSAREQRKRAIEDHSVAMQTARFQADMADRARQNQVQDILLPYKVQQAQRLALGPQTPTVPTTDKFARWGSLLGGAPSVGQSVVEPPVPTNTIPDLLPEEVVPMPTDPEANLNVIPDIPAY